MEKLRAENVALKDQIQILLDQSYADKFSLLEKYEKLLDESKLQREKFGKLEEKIRNQDEEIKKLQTELEICRRGYTEHLPEIYDKIMGTTSSDENKESASLDKNFRLILYSNCAKSQKFMKECVKLKIKLPDIKEIRFRTIYDDGKLMRDFLKFSIPNSLGGLNLNTGGMRYNNLSISTWIDCLKHVLGKISGFVGICDFILSKEEVETIINSAKCSTFHFRCCTIGSCKGLALTNSTIDSLSFRGSGISSKSNWVKNITGLKDIMEAVGDSPMKYTLNKFNVIDCDLDLKRCKKLADETQLGSDKVVEEDW